MNRRAVSEFVVRNREHIDAELPLRRSRLAAARGKKTGGARGQYPATMRTKPGKRAVLTEGRSLT